MSGDVEVRPSCVGPSWALRGPFVAAFVAPSWPPSWPPSRLVRGSFVAPFVAPSWPPFLAPWWRHDRPAGLSNSLFIIARTPAIAGGFSWGTSKAS